MFSAFFFDPVCVSKFGGSLLFTILLKSQNTRFLYVSKNFISKKRQQKFPLKKKVPDVIIKVTSHRLTYLFSRIKIIHQEKIEAAAR